MDQSEPTEEDVRTLAHARFLEQRFSAGIFPRSGADTAHFRKLARFGMLRFTGQYGRDVDGMVERDVPLWELTDQGRSWIDQHEAAAA